ncbi:MAG: NAD-dependent malic enzyme [Solirubrobacterales bacterium]
MPADYVYRIEQPHRAGQLARVCSAISEAEGLIGDIETVKIGRHRSVRQINIEVADEQQAESISDRLGEVEGVRVLDVYDRAISAHHGGKIRMEANAPVKTLQDMRDVYTPGVARVCEAIAEDESLARRYTMIGTTIAICTNGTRVLGLGDIGPTASMPVMEGKALFYRRLAGISAVPLLISAREPDEFVETVSRLSCGFGAIHLEDISAPECFEIEERLISGLDIPVMHDDVHGTAVAALAAVIVGCHQTDISLDEATLGQIGLGAAGLGIAGLAVQAGTSRVLAADPDEQAQERARERGIEIASMEEVMENADVVCATTGKPGLIEPSSVREGQVILALSNPEPEITPEDALEAGASFAADGSMVNNVLGFPGIFRGALACGASRISESMKLAAAGAIANFTEASELVPDPLDAEVHARVAQAVANAAEAEGLAREAFAPEHLDAAPGA